MNRCINTEQQNKCTCLSSEVDGVGSLTTDELADTDPLLPDRFLFDLLGTVTADSKISLLGLEAPLQRHLSLVRP